MVLEQKQTVKTKKLYVKSVFYYSDFPKISVS